MYVWRHIYICTYICAQGTRRGCLIPSNWSYSCLWATIWGLGTEPGSSTRARNQSHLSSVKSNGHSSTSSGLVAYACNQLPGGLSQENRYRFGASLGYIERFRLRELQHEALSYLKRNKSLPEFKVGPGYLVRSCPKI